MKKFNFFFLLVILFQISGYSQSLSDYLILPGDKKTLLPEGKLSLHVVYVDSSHTIRDAVPSVANLIWMVNGHPLNALVPTDGDLNLKLGHENEATYTAPEVPDKNPIAITVSITDPDEKGKVILYCNVTVLRASYKITMDAEQTISDAGQDIKLHGKCYANLKTLPNGTYFLEPLDKTRNMKVTVEKAIYVSGDGGSGKLITPYSYTFPFLISIGKMDKTHSSGPCTVYLNYTSPQEGKVVWQMKNLTETVDIDSGKITYKPGRTIQFGKPGNPAENAIALSAATNLNLLNYLIGTNPENAIQNAHQNLSDAQSQLDFAKRMEAHENDPNYFKTAQGKADLQKAMAFQKQIGGNIANISNQTKQLDAEMDSKTTNNPDYAGSKKFQQDIGKEGILRLGDEDVTGNEAMAKVTPGIGSVRIKGSFNAKSALSFSGEENGDIKGVNVSIKIKVEKLGLTKKYF
ncbi:MAG TPA: hypothetical protein VFI29_11205 [Hanamia sp.]|nr:hypothetical protein [Hanamia sp.]